MSESVPKSIECHSNLIYSSGDKSGFSFIKVMRRC